MRVFRMDLSGLQPSRLYVSAEKLAAVERTLSEGKPVDPVPVARLDGRDVLTDGHTRAVAALRRGDRTIPAVRETDEVDWEAYRICVRWCLDAGIESIADLDGRVIPEGRFEERWIRRCRRMQRRLAAGRAREVLDA